MKTFGSTNGHLPSLHSRIISLCLSILILAAVAVPDKVELRTHSGRTIHTCQLKPIPKALKGKAKARNSIYKIRKRNPVSDLKLTHSKNNSILSNSISPYISTPLRSAIPEPFSPSVNLPKIYRAETIHIIGNHTLDFRRINNRNSNPLYSDPFHNHKPSSRLFAVGNAGDGTYFVGDKRIESLNDLLPAINLFMMDNYPFLGNTIKIKVFGLSEGDLVAKIGNSEGCIEAEGVLLDEYDIRKLRIIKQSDNVFLLEIPSKVMPLERMFDNKLVLSVRGRAVNGVKNVLQEMFDEYECWDDEVFLEKLEAVGIDSDDIIEEYRSIIFAEIIKNEYEYQMA